MSYLEEFAHLLPLCGIFILWGINILIKKRKYNLPPGPRGFPIVGYLPFLGNNPPLKLQKLSKQYGDIFSVYFGRTHVVVVTDVAIAKELLNKSSVLDRPENLFQLMPGGVGLTEHNGPLWVEQRRYTIAEMKNLGLGRSHWEKLVEIEVRDFLDILAKYRGESVDIQKELSASISNNVLSLVTGHNLPVGHPERDIIDRGVEAFQLIYAQSGLISYYPKLFKFFVEVGLINVGEKLKDMANMNKCIRKGIDELQEVKEGHSYIQKYLSEIEKSKRLNLRNSFNVANLIGNVQSLIMAGSDTTKVSLQWLFLAMASFPDVQDKVQKEIDAELGKEGSANWIDRNKLPYCHATVLEGQRWRTVVPLNLQHRTTEDLEFYGFEIPKGTQIMTVIEAFHNDTRYWKDPNVFQPERFLTKDRKTVKEPGVYLPFSYGKRMCPGKTVGLIEIFHYLVAIMQKFRILPASKTQQPDLEGFLGLTLHPKPQPLRFVLR